MDLVDRLFQPIMSGSATLPEEDRESLLRTYGRAWSAASMPVDGKLYVLLNPTHSPARHSPTLAEELVHTELGHPKSKLITVDGITTRTCRQDVESEAYGVAVALLLPYQVVFRHIDGGGTPETMPANTSISDECVRYRIKVTGLWRTYQARQRYKAS
jgi:Zn-dependent peptidase ImmA (M78 family)